MFDEKKQYLNKEKGKGKGGGSKSRAHGKSAKFHRNDDDDEETGFIFKIFGVEEESTESDQLGVSPSTSGYIDETEEVSLPKSSVVLSDSLTDDIFTRFLNDDGIV